MQGVQVVQNRKGGMPGVQNIVDIGGTDGQTCGGWLVRKCKECIVRGSQ